MKKTLCLKLFLLLLLLYSNCLLAEDIYKIDFSTDIGKGYWGNESDMENVLEWSVDVSDCILADENDYVKVSSTSGGRLEARDCDGEAVWKSKIIDISGYSDVNISILLAETGSSTNTNKYIRAYYVIDGSSENLLEINADNEGNWGSSDASQSNISGSTLELIIRMNNPNSGDLVYLDNILVSGDPIIPESDVLTKILPSNDPIQSSRIKSTSNDSTNSFSCFKFVIDETDQAVDGFSTKISRICLYNSHPVGGVDWLESIGGVLLFDGANEILTSTVTISKDSIVIDFEEGVFEVDDAGKIEVELSLYLNSEKPIIDTTKFQLHIKETAIGFETFSTGSSFSKVNDKIESEIHRIDVQSSRMNIFSLNKPIVRNKDFSLEVIAMDEYGNVDLEDVQELELFLKSGSGVLNSTNNMIQNLISGRYIFSNLQYTIPETIQLAVRSENFQESISDEILVENTQETYVNVVDSQIIDKTLSSLWIKEEQAFEVLKFRITDSGNDDLSTLLKKVEFRASELNNLNWKKSVEQFFLKKEGKILETQKEVDNNKLNFTLTNEDGEVGSELSVEYSIWCYLKKGKVTDGTVFQMQIDSLHTGWEIFNDGSGLLEEFSGNLIGEKFTVQVRAEEMIFSEVPKQVEYQEEFTIEIELVDRYGNLDKDMQTEVELSIATGNGLLTPEPLKRSNAEGKFIWNNLIYNKAENFTLQADNELFSTILTKNISALDRSSEISSGALISAIELDPLRTSVENAIPILNFSISDDANHDLEPTVPTSIKFLNAKPINYFSWPKHIEGAVLISDNEIVAETNDITDDYIRFASSKGIFEVENASNRNFSLGIYFRKSQLPDNRTLQVQIPREDNEWKCLLSGSSIIETLSEDIVSEVHSINVVSANLVFVNVPFAIGKSDEYFSIDLATCDAHNNIDIDVNSTIEIQLDNGTGEFTIDDNNLILEKGILQLDSVKYMGDDDFGLRTKSGFKNDTISILFGKDELSINENFESQQFENWRNTADWKVSSYNPISGDYSLKHNLSAETGRSNTSLSLKDYRPNTCITNWSFILKNGDWDPSTGNKFVFHLLMDNENPDQAKIKYSVGINHVGSNDLLSLWSTDHEDNKTSLIESGFNWNENEKIAIQVRKTANGFWKIKYNRLGDKNNWLLVGSVRNELKTNSKEWYSGLEFSFESASRAGELWLDDVRIESINTDPYLKNHQLIGQDSLLLVYSEKLNLDASGKVGNFKWILNEVEDVDFTILDSDKEDCIILKVTKKLSTGDYQLDISNITDVKGAVCKSERINFNYFAPAIKHDLIINELMLDESPVVALPEYEYMELYNSSSYPINLTSWMIQVGDKEYEFEKDTLSTHEYIIFCKKEAVEYFKKYGKVHGLESFPILKNAGVDIQLFSPEGELIDELSCSDSWYDSELKKNGGWSLERIDPNNHSWQELNWNSSVDESGGTPGKENSIFSLNSDQETPLLLECRFIKPFDIQLSFSEPIDAYQSLLTSNYKVNSSMNNPDLVSQIDEMGKEFILNFTDEFVTNQKYVLSLTDEIKDLAGNSILEKEYEFWIPAAPEKGDIVINEVLFNPFAGGSDYVEIYNKSEKVIDLSTLKLGTRNDNFDLVDTVYFSDEFIHPQAFVLVSADTSNVVQNYFSLDSEVFCQTKSIPSYPDEEGRVVISHYGNVIDDFKYNKEMHFELLASDDGVALERVNPVEETNSDSNWQSAAQNIGFGTPGIQNSVFSERTEESSEISLDKKIFSPNNDGIDDRLLINFNLKEDGYLVSIRIFNSQGTEIRKLATNLNLANNDQLFWDGIASNKQRAPIGVYLVYIELFNAEGDVKSMKKSCVLSGRFN